MGMASQRTLHDHLMASITLPTEERSTELTMLRLALILIFSVGISLPAAIFVLLFSGSDSLRLFNVKSLQLFRNHPENWASNSPQPASDEQQRNVRRGIYFIQGQFVQPIGSLGPSDTSYLEEAIAAAAPLEQYDYDMKAFKAKLLQPGTVRLFFLITDSVSTDFAKLRGYGEVCNGSDFLCVVLDARKDFTPLPMRDSDNIVYLSVPERHLALFLVSAGLKASQASGLFVFDKTGQLLWFGPSRHLDVLAREVQAVVRTAHLIKLAMDKSQQEVVVSISSAEYPPMTVPPKDDPRQTTQQPQHPSDSNAPVQGRQRPEKIPVKDAATVDAQGSEGPSSVKEKRQEGAEHPLKTSALIAEVTEAKTGVTTTFAKSWAIKQARNKARPILVSFWGTWCPPCIKELPDLGQLNQRFGDTVFFISLAQELSTPESRQLIQEMTGKHGLRFQYISPDTSMARLVFSSPTDVALPAFAVFDKRGHLVGHLSGSLLHADNMQQLVSLLEQVTEVKPQ
jgi:thiol-disulfide isomerase/thioredoxin